MRKSFTDSSPLADEGPRVLSASLVPELHVNMVVPDFECVLSASLDPELHVNMVVTDFECVHSGSQTQIVTLVWQDPS